MNNTLKDFQIPYISRALKVSPHKIKLMGSPSSPPSWMKTNNKFNESGALRGAVGGQYYQTWANYFVKYLMNERKASFFDITFPKRFLNAYKSHGIDFWGLTVENEPINGEDPHYTFNGLNMTKEMERDFVKMNLGPTLEKAGYGKNKVKLMIFDDFAKHMKEWMHTILSDKEAAKYVSGIAYHWYGNHPMSGFPDGFLTDVHKSYPDYFLLSTEACHLAGADLGRWDAGERYAYDIIRVI
jgi:glucosylceramidase